MKILTDRLLLRRFTPDDLDRLAGIRSDPEVMRYIGNGEPNSREQTRAAIDRSIATWEREGFGRWAVIDREQARLIGWCGLAFLDTTTEIEIGYGLERSAWGNGFITEAAAASLRDGFERMKIERIVAVAFPENLGSIEVMKKLGMRFAGYAPYYGADALARYEIDAREFIPRPGRYEPIEE